MGAPRPTVTSPLAALADERIRVGDLEGAERIFRKLLRRTAGRVEALHGLGRVALERGHPRQAASLIEAALAAGPPAPRLYLSLGAALTSAGALDAALHAYRQALRLAPDDGTIYNALGRLFHDTGAFAQARSCYRTAIRVQPDLADSYCNLGNLLVEYGDPAAAAEWLHTALRLESDNAETVTNLAVADLDRGRPDAARDRFRRACRLRPDSGALYGYWAHALLQRGYLSEGWRNNERTLALGTRVVSPCPAPFWSGQALAGRSLLVLAEQGIGDQLMFASCLPDLLEQAGSARCILECDARLIPLYRRTFPGLHCHPRRTAGDADDRLPPVDFKVAIGSLANIYRGTLECFPDAPGYVRADARQILHWRRRYAALGAERVIGISWRGGFPATQRQRRSTGLAQWAPILTAPRTAFVNLQYGATARELALARERCGVRVHDWPDTDTLRDLDGLAARIAALDLVLSVDNSTAHMAGAVGAPVWCLLPVAADWRWMRAGDSTRWYPNMTLIRQRTPGDWDDVLRRVRARLDARPAPQRERE